MDTVLPNLPWWTHFYHWTAYAVVLSNPTFSVVCNHVAHFQGSITTLVGTPKNLFLMTKCSRLSWNSIITIHTCTWLHYWSVNTVRNVSVTFTLWNGEKKIKPACLLHFCTSKTAEWCWIALTLNSLSPSKWIPRERWHSGPFQVWRTDFGWQGIFDSEYSAWRSHSKHCPIPQSWHTDAQQSACYEAHCTDFDAFGENKCRLKEFKILKFILSHLQHLLDK